MTRYFEIYSEFRGWIAGLLSAMLAFLHPIAGDLYSMLLLFGANVVFGIIADISSGGKWDKKKFWNAIKEALLFFALVFFIFGIGSLKNNVSGAQQCVSFVSYSLIYYYGTNICRNMKQLLPDGSIGHKVFAWFYWILSVEFIKKIPGLMQYLQGKAPLEAAQEAKEGSKDQGVQEEEETE
jgi:hypothetical protein